MAQTLRLKRSSVAGRVPTTATLQTGEIAINTADGLVYIRKDDDSIIPLLGVNTAAVTGDVVLIGSIEATSFTGSFSGSFTGPIVGTLSKTVGSGDGIVSFLFDGSNDVTVTLDTGSDHFRNAVINLIDTNAPSIVAQDTTGAGGIDLSYNSETGALSGSLVNSQITIGDNTVALGQTLTRISNLEVTGSFKGDASGSFTGDFTGDGSQLTGITASLVGQSLKFGSGLTGGTYDGTAPVTASLDGGSLAFRQAVFNSISVIDTFTSSGVNLIFNEVGGFNFLSAYLQSTTIQLGDTTLQLAQTASSVSNLILTDVVATGSFSGSFRGELLTTASWAYNAISASHAVNSDTAISATSAITAATASTSDFVLIQSTALPNTFYVTFTPGTGRETPLYSGTMTYEADTDTLVVTNISGNIDSANTAISASYAAFASSASYALYAANVINPDTGSFMTTGSVSNATITFTKADESTFDIIINNVESASYAATASSADTFLVRNDATVQGDLTVDGIITAREFHTTFVSASIVFKSGSTKFGDTADDIHEFTGSILLSGSISSYDISINDWGSVSASLALISSSAASITLQQVTDNGNVTTLPITASNLNITGFPDVSASLASLESTNTLQGVTDNGNTTTNQIIINNELIVSQSIYSKGEEVLDFAVAMAIALG